MWSLLAVVPARLLPAVVESCIPAGAVCPPVVIPTSGDTTSVDPTVMFKGFGDQLQNQFGGIIKWALPIGVGLFVLSKGWELLKDLIAPDLGSEEDEDEAYKMNSLYDSQERSARVRELRNM